jgi:RimJ/RimL family protein N-acetyltransferase
MQNETRFISLLTDRLILRELEPGDVDALFDLFGDPVATQHFPRVLTRDETAEWIERNRRRYRIFGYGLWAVVLRDTGEVLGNCGPVWHEINNELQLEIGYHFRRRYWGKGYATEAARAVMEWCFENIPVDYLISLIREQNMPSRRVAERNGLVVTGVGLFHDMEHLIYRMDRARWEERIRAKGS